MAKVFNPVTAPIGMEHKLLRNLSFLANSIVFRCALSQVSSEAREVMNILFSLRTRTIALIINVAFELFNRVSKMCDASHANHCLFEEEA